MKVSIDFDGPIYPSHEGVCGEESDCASQETIDQTSQEAVGEEQHRADQAGDVEVVHVVINAVEEDPDG